ncbi:MAG: MBOAT family protein, partial [Betaproteobacteria bacterium]|nr:MBOAT family protein [Betaproteobacteria bacterium]
YSLQIYFDFSGYTDMALGAALMFNIRLPLNFDSPYRATNLQDFWRRWHITLSRFLRDYVYVPLGGGRGTGLIVSRNVLLTFLVGGFWHGAGWTFLVWGALHGVGLVVVLQWRRWGWAMPAVMAWALTLLFVHLTWVFFRADSWQSALTILRALVPSDWAISSLMPILRAFQADFPLTPSMTLVVAGVLCLLPINSNRLAERFNGRVWEGGAVVVLLTFAVLLLGRVSPFLYFNF